MDLSYTCISMCIGPFSISMFIICRLIYFFMSNCTNTKRFIPLFYRILIQVLHTKRFVFAPSKGSAAVETNPSDSLLAALEGSHPRSLLQYLAYLDLCMVCGSNIEPWRRAAFFEETGETYKRVVAACMRPLEQFASKLAEGLTSSTENVNKLSHQLSSPNEIIHSSEILESFGNFQVIKLFPFVFDVIYIKLVYATIWWTFMFPSLITCSLGRFFDRFLPTLHSAIWNWNVNTKLLEIHEVLNVIFSKVELPYEAMLLVLLSVKSFPYIAFLLKTVLM